MLATIAGCGVLISGFIVTIFGAISTLLGYYGLQKEDKLYDTKLVGMSVAFMVAGVILITISIVFLL